MFFSIFFSTFPFSFYSTLSLTLLYNAPFHLIFKNITFFIFQFPFLYYRGWIFYIFILISFKNFYFHSNSLFYFKIFLISLLFFIFIFYFASFLSISYFIIFKYILYSFLYSLYFNIFYILFL